MEVEAAAIRLNLAAATFAACLFIFVCCNNPISSGAVQLTQDNFDTLLATNELVFINFYADWCRFSNMLAPIFDESADKIAQHFPDKGQVVLGKVDCDKDTSIATRFHITKYPTLKLIQNGQIAKREYRGQRSADAFLKYIQEQMADPIKEYQSLEEIQNLDDKKRNIIGYFRQRDSVSYSTFRRVATNLKDDCEFHVGFGGDFLAPHAEESTSQQMHPPDQDIIAFRSARARSSESDDTYVGGYDNFEELHAWVSSKCVPLVREITFENAEELTEEGLPFLILFHRPDDNEVVKRYTDLVHRELLTEKQNVNFLTADGVKFAHPLHHMGKSPKDLPLIAIDSFRHMYLFPDASRMDEPNLVRQFLQDLYSGKLHREFHYGPDPVQASADSNDIDPGSPDPSDRKITSPPESTFKKLAPSRNRYTLLRDEL